jgi:hypothetical protein
VLDHSRVPHGVARRADVKLVQRPQPSTLSGTSYHGKPAITMRAFTSPACSRNVGKPVWGAAERCLGLRTAVTSKTRKAGFAIALTSSFRRPSATAPTCAGSEPRPDEVADDGEHSSRPGRADAGRPARRSARTVSIATKATNPDRRRGVQRSTGSSARTQTVECPKRSQQIRHSCAARAHILYRSGPAALSKRPAPRSPASIAQPQRVYDRAKSVLQQ